MEHRADIVGSGRCLSTPEAMAVPPNLTLMANAMKMEKEIFWLHNRHLEEDERQRQWTAHTAELASALGAAAPTEPLELTDDIASLNSKKQHDPVPFLKPTVLTQNSFAMATTLLPGPPEADFGLG